MKPSALSSEPGRVERLTSTTFFVVLVVMSALVVSPVLLIGFVFLFASIAGGETAAIPVLGPLVGGGLAGLAQS